MSLLSSATDAMAHGAVRARRTLRQSRGEQGFQFVGLDGVKFDRVAEDAKPGTRVGRLEGGDATAITRGRVELDGKTLELKTIPGRSRRVDPSQDVKMTDAANMQLHIIAPKLAGVDAKRLGVDGASEAAAEAEVARNIARKHGTGDAAALWRVGAHSTAFLNTVSRLAALDGLSAIFLQSELTVQLPDLVRVEQQKPSARDILAMRFLNAPGAVDYEFNKFERKGKAEHTADFRGKVPTASLTRDPIRRPLRWSRSGMSYTWLELQQWSQAKKNGMPLPDFVKEYAEAAREALLELENLDLFFGNTNLDIHGLLSAENYASAFPTAISNFVNAASPEAAVQLLLTGAKRIFATRRFVADVIMLGTRDYMYITTATYLDSNGTSAGKSIADITLERGKPLGLKAIVHVPELAYDTEMQDYLESLGYKNGDEEKYAGGIATKDVMVTMARDPNVSRGICGQDIMQFPPDQTATETTVQLAMSTGGYEVRHPDAIDVQPVNAPA